jgi:hypothetical protein
VGSEVVALPTPAVAQRLTVAVEPVSHAGDRDVLAVLADQAYAPHATTWTTVAQRVDVLDEHLRRLAEAVPIGQDAQLDDVHGHAASAQSGGGSPT